MTASIEQQEKIDRLVDIFLNDMESMTHTAGWHQDSMLARMITFEGEVPEPTRNDRSNAKMIYEITFLRNEHHDLKLAKAAMRALFRRNSSAAMAILSRRFYRGNYLCPKTNTLKVFKDTNRAWSVGQSPKQYRANLNAAYQHLQDILSLISEGYLLASGKAKPRKEKSA